MILVTVGTQLPFDRLIRAVDQWAATHPEMEVVAQTGSGGYTPAHFPTRRTIDPTEFHQLIQRAQVIVSHAGMGTILSALELGKPLILLARLAVHHEHRNDHQIATAARFQSRAQIHVADDESQVGQLLDQLLSRSNDFHSDDRISATAPAEFIERLRAFINGDDH